MADEVGLDRRRFLSLTGAAFASATLLGPVDALAAARPAAARRLSFLNLHTGERLTAEYFAGGRYQKDALQAINTVLRDHRTDTRHPIDPRLLDLVHALQMRLGRPQQIHVISGYRSPQSNAMLHETGDGVARNSFHMRGMAIDLRIPGIDTRRIYRAARSMRRGGVGYYPRSDFVHMDVGPVRSW